MNDETTEVMTREEQEQFAQEQQEAALKRRDLLGPDALDKLRKRQEVELQRHQDAVVRQQIVGGNFSPQQLRDAMDFATMMAAADIAIPIHLRANPGACLAITMQSIAWGFEPFFVANKSYAVKQKKSGDVRIAYESQLLHAVVERRAPLSRRLEPIWKGEGGDLECHIHGHLIGEPKPLIWEGVKLKDVRIKNSPEWVNNPKKQLFYHSSRDWARIYVPDVLGGAYTRDELEGVTLGPNAVPEENVLTRLGVLPQENDYDADQAVRALESGRQPAQQREEGPIEVRTEGTSTRKPRKPAKGPDPAETKLTPGQEPTTPREYATWAETWIGNIETSEQADVAELRWDHEQAMRSKLRLSLKERQRLKDLLTAACGKARGD